MTPIVKGVKTAVNVIESTYTVGVLVADVSVKGIEKLVKQADDYLDNAQITQESKQRVSLAKRRDAIATNDELALDIQADTLIEVAKSKVAREYKLASAKQKLEITKAKNDDKLNKLRNRMAARKSKPALPPVAEPSSLPESSPELKPQGEYDSISAPQIQAQ